MRIAVYSGSFDIVTEGHLWMIKKGIELFDKLIVGIGTNPSKQTLFDFKTRKQLLEMVCADLSDKLSIEDFSNLALVQFAHDKNAKYILRGIRSISDFDYERMLKNVNTDLDDSIETVFLMPPKNLSEVSSSMIKGMLKIQGWEIIIKRYVPEAMQSALIERFSCDPIQVAQLYLGDSISETLKNYYHQFGRYYHNLDHLTNGLREFREIEKFLQNPYAVLIALLFHDIVYEPTAPALANETASCELAKQLCDFDEKDHAEIINHILHTSHHYEGHRNSDTDYLCDIDMAILGVSESEFEQYEQAIRQEYSCFNDEQYKSGRLSFLKNLLDRKTIYKTSYFRMKYESNARANIEKLIQQLLGS
ncbi:Phosphopantetheine adenylyltransferase [Patescibacteria group bacterium]|nr:Phosphopantetheine adenylyltransferase [Patescibacteria group bacterium]